VRFNTDMADDGAADAAPLVVGCDEAPLSNLLAADSIAADVAVQPDGPSSSSALASASASAAPVHRNYPCVRPLTLEAFNKLKGGTFQGRSIVFVRINSKGKFENVSGSSRAAASKDCPTQVSHRAHRRATVH
jgi:hypothetical protein